MKCKEAKLAFSKYLDRRLGDAEGRRLEAHIHICERCGESFRIMEASSRALRSLDPTPAPPYLAERAFRVAVSPRRVTRFSEQFAFVARRAAIAAALAAMGLWIGGGLTNGLREMEPRMTMVEADPMEMAIYMWTPGAIFDD